MVITRASVACKADGVALPAESVTGWRIQVVAFSTPPHVGDHQDAMSGAVTE
jgi:hypothetical protein